MKILVIGYKGSYGGWLYNLLGSVDDYEVIGIEQSDTYNIPNFTRYIQYADVIIPAVSLGSALKVTRFVSEKACKDSLIIDISSSKKEVFEILERKNCDYVTIHPMCAPSENGHKISKDKKVYYVGSYFYNEENKIFFNQFKGLIGGSFRALSLEDHHVVEELNQATVHNLLIALASALASSGLSLEKAKEYSTPVSIGMYESLERFLEYGNPETTAKLIELGMRHSSRILLAANKSIVENQSVGIPRYCKKIADRMKRLRKRILKTV